jgi:hypothetical protein
VQNHISDGDIPTSKKRVTPHSLVEVIHRDFLPGYSMERWGGGE